MLNPLRPGECEDCRKTQSNVIHSRMWKHVGGHAFRPHTKHKLKILKQPKGIFPSHWGPKRYLFECVICSQFFIVDPKDFWRKPDKPFNLGPMWDDIFGAFGKLNRQLSEMYFVNPNQLKPQPPPDRSWVVTEDHSKVKRPKDV